MQLPVRKVHPASPVGVMIWHGMMFGRLAAYAKDQSLKRNHASARWFAKEARWNYEQAQQWRGALYC